MGIAIASEMDGIHAWIDRHGIDFSTLHGMSPGEKASVCGGVGVARTYLVQDETLRLGMIGARRLEELERAMNSLGSARGETVMPLFFVLVYTARRPPNAPT